MKNLRSPFVPGSAGQGELITKRGMLGTMVFGDFIPLPIAGSAYGTLSSLDTLASSQQSVAEFGEDNAWAAIQVSLEAHNAQTREMFGELVELTNDRRRRYGGVDAMQMDEVDEFGRPDAQKISAGATVDFPLRLYAISVQWTRKAFQNMPAAQLAANFVAAQDADVTTLLRELKRAMFRAANYSTTDRLVDQVALAVKRFVNADSAVIPLGPQGVAFDGATHTHYLATASLIAANLAALIETVMEHHSSGETRVYLNRASETAVRALTGFTAYVDSRLIPANSAQTAPGQLDRFQINNRAIGIFSSGGVTAEIWVKPWIPANYMFAFVAGAPAPVVMRTRGGVAGGPTSGLVVAAEDEAHPLRARTLDHEYGFGVWTRTNGAILQTNNGTYVDPTIA